MSDEYTDDLRPGDERELARLEELLRQLDVDDLDPQPAPAAVWEAIELAIADDRPAAPVRTLTPRRRQTVWWAAAAAIVALAGAGVLLRAFDGGTRGDVVSAAVLAFDPASFDPRGAGAAARAQLVERDGALVIELTDAELPDVAGSDLELWLIEPDATGTPVDVVPVSLVDRAGDGVYAVPSGIDPATHFVVDISIEPRDGDAAHSGKSILRGALEAR